MEMKITASTLLLLVGGMLVHVLPTICTAAGGFSLPLVANHGGGRYRVDADGFMVVNATSFHHRPPLTPPLEYTYGVAVTIGTGRGKSTYFLVLDTASSLPWMRCAHCLPVQRQRSPVFDPSDSSSYRPLHPTSPLCRAPNPVLPAGDKCSFHLPGEAHGYVGTDTIILGNPTLPIHSVAFGCAQSTEGFDTKGTFAGTLGMGRLPTSLIMQIKDRVGSRFSYCLIGLGHSQGRNGFIRFGADIPDPTLLVHHRIKILPTPPHLPHGVADSAYYVKLLGISLNGTPIPGIRQAMFERRSDGSGGCFVDAGTQVTHLVPAAYAVVEEAVAHMVQQWGYKRVRDPNFSLCFREHPGIWSHIPKLTLDFEGPASRTVAHLEIVSRNLFLKVDNQPLVCFGVYRTSRGSPTVVGAMQQVDTRFIFDLHANTITFHRESCEADTVATPSEW
ncbi:aspartic proteinase nepenthesin-1-like [Hordeum vulgare subsp. vulgare]|uniref:Peptidase A1 domain-containing protein n=1 Tax=Hordeum vulgare subsp. vulgare TaxID=112509 RepID=A0A8I6Y7Y1_HORVV|nr:aspartic proteinase nepenthesin-1-like [Hordeum vulgare subsp. vulgare]